MFDSFGPQAHGPGQSSSRCPLPVSPVWPSGKTSRKAGKAEGPWFNSASALLGLQMLCCMDIVFVTLPTPPPQSNETLKWLSPMPIYTQNDCGGDSVALGIVSLFPLLCQLSPRHYLFGDKWALSIFVLTKALDTHTTILTET